MHVRPRQTDRRTNIMTIARRFVLIRTHRALKNRHPWAVRLSWLENAYSRPLFNGWDANCLSLFTAHVQNWLPTFVRPSVRASLPIYFIRPRSIRRTTYAGRLTGGQASETVSTPGRGRSYAAPAVNRRELQDQRCTRLWQIRALYSSRRFNGQVYRHLRPCRLLKLVYGWHNHENCHIYSSLFTRKLVAVRNKHQA